MNYDFEINKGTAKLAVVLGLMRYDERADVYYLTDRGEKYLRDYCDRIISTEGPKPDKEEK